MLLEYEKSKNIALVVYYSDPRTVLTDLDQLRAGLRDGESVEDYALRICVQAVRQMIDELVTPEFKGVLLLKDDVVSLIRAALAYPHIKDAKDLPIVAFEDAAE